MKLSTTVLAAATIIAGAFNQFAVDAQGQPNIIFILVDDQDAVYDSAQFMPNLQKNIASTGATYNNHFVVHPVCCPSRTNIMRSQCSHNTNMTNVFAPYGGYTKFHQQNLDDDYLPVWMQNLGYWTGYAGKFLVEYGLTNYQDYPKGWDDFDALMFPYTFDYFNPVFSRNGQYPTSFAGQYSTDVIANKTLNLLDEAHASGKPFFIMTAPIGPHVQMTTNMTCLQNGIAKNGGNSTGVNALVGFACTRTTDPVPADRHKDLFNDQTVPRTPSFNQESDMSSYPNWLRFMPPLSAQNITKIDEHHRNRLRSLQAIDDMIGAIFDKLDALGNREDTYVFYSSDNGYHLGAHRTFAGKETTFDEDIRVPMYITGPGIAAGNVTERTLHLDIAPTIVSLAGGPFPLISDGQVMPVPGIALDGLLMERVAFGTSFYGAKLDEIAAGETFTPLQIGALSKGLNVPGVYQNFTWRGIRVEKEGFGAFKYAVYCDGPNNHELYDLEKDPYELHNVYADYLSNNKSFLDRLDAHLTVTGTCKSIFCVNPTLFLHRDDGSATNFFETLDPKFDAKYAAYPKFFFRKCLNFPHVANEVGFVNLTFVPPDGAGMDKSQLAGAALIEAVAETMSWFLTHPDEISAPLSQIEHDLNLSGLMIAAPFIWH